MLINLALGSVVFVCRNTSPQGVCPSSLASCSHLERAMGIQRWEPCHLSSWSQSLTHCMELTLQLQAVHAIISIIPLYSRKTLKAHVF